MKPLILPETNLRELAETGKTERRQVCDPQPEKFHWDGCVVRKLYKAVWPLDAIIIGVHGGYPSLAAHSPFGATGKMYMVNDMQVLSTVTLERRNHWEWVQVLEVVR